MAFKSTIFVADFSVSPCRCGACGSWIIRNHHTDEYVDSERSLDAALIHADNMARNVFAFTLSLVAGGADHG